MPLAKVAARIAAGKTLREMGIKEVTPEARRGQGGGVSVREVRRRRHHPRPGDALDRRGHGHRRPPSRRRSARARLARARSSRRRAPAFLSVQDSDKAGTVQVAKGLIDLGFEVVATVGTHTFLTSKGLDVKRVNKVREGRPHIVDRHPRRRHSPGHQHDLGRRGDQGFVPDPAQRPAQGHPLLHDAVGGARRGRRDRGPARGQDHRPLAAGVPEWLSSR